MSLIRDVNITAQDNATIDAFGRIRVSDPFTLLDTKQLVDNLPLFYDDQETAGSGTGSTHDPNTASSTMTVSSGVAGTRVRQTKLRGTYQPGKSLLVLATFVMGSVPGSASVVMRSHATGSTVDTVIPQASWNLDKMDGTGRSGIAIDPTKTQILLIDLEWLGVGRVRFGFVIDGKVYYCHEFNNANNLDKVYMSTPNLPIRYEIESDGTTVKKKVGYFDENNGLFLQCEGGSNSLEHICSSVVSEGGQQATVLQTYISRHGTPVTLANQDLYTPVISLRLKTTHIGTRISPVLIDVLATSNINYEWKLFLNPTIAGTDLANWVDETNSALQYDITRNATNLLTGGHIIAGGYGASSAQFRNAITGIASSYLSIGSNIDNSVDQLVLGVANIDGNGGTVYGGMVIDEYN